MALFLAAVAATETDGRKNSRNAAIFYILSYRLLLFKVVWGNRRSFARPHLSTTGHAGLLLVNPGQTRYNIKVL